jgi:hypothetical protein
MPVILATQEAEEGGSLSKDSLGKDQRPNLKNKLKQKCSVAQVAQHLPRKHEALSSDPSIAKQQVLSKSIENTDSMV